MNDKPILQPNETLVIMHSDGSVFAGVKNMENIDRVFIENNDAEITVTSIDYQYFGSADKWELAVVEQPVEDSLFGPSAMKFIYTAKVVWTY